MDKVEINLAWMYPDILNLHGERGSIQAFNKIADNLGVKLKTIRINNYKEEIDFNNIDIMIFLPGELKVLPIIKESLSNKIEEIYQYILANKYMISIGTTGALFGKKIIRQNGEELEGLGLLDFNAQERKTVIGDDLYFYVNETKQQIMGSQIQMIDIQLQQEDPLGNIIYGYGNNGSKVEGVRNKNLIVTNCLGPVFVKNPWWTENILKNIILNKYGNIQKKEEYQLENLSFETTKRFIFEKTSI